MIDGQTLTLDEAIAVGRHNVNVKLPPDASTLPYKDSIVGAAGASLDTTSYARSVVSTEINSWTDNPLIFVSEEAETEIISGGNLHGQPIDTALDYLAIVLAILGPISERRISQLNNAKLSCGLPRFLSKNTGLNSGFMIAQYTAAALISENHNLASPASINSIPVCTDKEDHVSMGMTAAREVHEVVEHLKKILAIEMLCGCQALGFSNARPGSGSRAVYKVIRKYVNLLDEGRPLYNDIDKVSELIGNREIIRTVEDSIGELPI